MQMTVPSVIYNHQVSSILSRLFAVMGRSRELVDKDDRKENGLPSFVLPITPHTPL